MGRDNLFWKRKNASIGRKFAGKGKPQPAILILCEGEKTEPGYFKSFKLASVNVQVLGCGFNTYSLVDKARQIQEKAKKRNAAYDQLWCVFDKDDFRLDQVNAAFVLAKKEKIKVAFSNEAFELWYLLHFNYYDTAMSRTQYKAKLSGLMDKTYKKNSTSIFDELRDKQADAIRNAEKLLSRYTPKNPGRDNPSTTVHLLVKELNKFLKKNDP